MLNANKIVLLLILGHSLIKLILAITLLVRLHRTEAQNRIYHAKKDKAE